MLRLSEILAWVGLGRYGLIPDDQSRSDHHKKTGPYSAVDKRKQGKNSEALLHFFLPKHESESQKKN